MCFIAGSTEMADLCDDGCLVGERVEKLPDYATNLPEAWRNGDRVLVNGLAMKCISFFAVETVQDAMEWWIERYNDGRTMSCLLRDLWMIICSYVLPSSPVPVSMRALVSKWYFYISFPMTAIDKMNDLRTTLRWYTRSIQFNPQNASSICNRSLCHSMLGQFAEGLIDANEALALDNQCPYALHFKSKALAGLKITDQAIEHAQKALSLYTNPKHVLDCQVDIDRLKEFRIKSIVNAPTHSY